MLRVIGTGPLVICCRKTAHIFIFLPSFISFPPYISSSEALDPPCATIVLIYTFLPQLSHITSSHLPECDFLPPPPAPPSPFPCWEPPASIQKSRSPHIWKWYKRLAHSRREEKKRMVSMGIVFLHHPPSQIQKDSPFLFAPYLVIRHLNNRDRIVVADASKYAKVIPQS